jgi:SAM-dependent methyltransferase
MTQQAATVGNAAVTRTRGGACTSISHDSPDRMAARTLPPRAGSKVYDEAYFARWYHHSRTRVHSPDSVRRKVRMVLGVAEYLLRREVRSVLDIGAGEGAWRGELRRLRPSIKYSGIDPSDYVVRRYGKRRNITLGTFEDLPAMRLARGYDLIVCADVIQYVSDAALARGVERIASVLTGLAFLESYTTGDEMEGDLSGWHPRSKAAYRRIYGAAGLIGCGLHCYVTPEIAERAVELELV